jgi:nicotinate-nucleotide--dimethylbenzimidazole phosphoribosyltransferase
VSKSDEERARATRLASERQQELTKPKGSLGRLESLTLQLAAIQRNAIPRARPAAALIFAADHPVTAHGVSAYPQEVTRAMLANLARGGAAATVLARSLGVPLSVLDVGVAGAPLCEGIVDRHPVADQPRFDLRHEDAMSAATLELALRAGEEAVAHLDSELRVVLLGEIGIGNTTPAAALAAALLDREPAELVGPGTGLDAAGLGRKIDVVADALARIRAQGPAGPLDLLRRLGGPEIAALVGAIRRAHEQEVAVLVDGYTVSVAALLATRIDPSLREHLVFSHRSAEPGHLAVLDSLEAEPLLDLGMRLGEATGALAAFHLVELACRLHDEMATFAETSVPTALPRPESK